MITGFYIFTTEVRMKLYK